MNHPENTYTEQVKDFLTSERMLIAAEERFLASAVPALSVLREQGDLQGVIDKSAAILTASESIKKHQKIVRVLEENTDFSKALRALRSQGLL